jgi:hypothetical protein
VLLPAGQRVGPRVDDSASSPVRQSLCVTSRLQGTEQGTLTAPNNVATWTGQAGNAAADRDQFAVLLPVLEQVTAARDCMSMRARLMMATPGHAATGSMICPRSRGCHGSCHTRCTMCRG